MTKKVIDDAHAHDLDDSDRDDSSDGGVDKDDDTHSTLENP